ncbi:MAG: alpha-2-macroglobulin family protein [Verrucomicrobiales bacterium]
MNTLALRLLWLLLATLLPVNLNAATLAERRASADKAMKDGNWNDSLKIWREILVLPEHTGQPLAEDLGKAVQCVQQLNQWELWDAVVEETVKAHEKDWRLLQAAAVHFQTTQSWGTLISGEFQRGQHAGGKPVSSEDRDRVRSLQLLEQALNSVETADEKPEIKAAFYAASIQSIASRAGWELQALTDLTKLPDYEENQSGHHGGRGRWRGHHPYGDDRGAPVDEKGEPVWHHSPESWAAAKSDGERFRWLLAQQAKQGAKHALEADITFARWLRGQFDVQTIAPYWRAPEDDDDARRDGLLTLHTLKENETIARLATGVKRFTLPDEFSFIAIIERVFNSDPGLGLADDIVEEFADIFRNRRQYERATTIYRNALERLAAHTEKDLKESWQAQLDQIVKNWGRFDGSFTQVPGAGAKLGFVFRNAKHVSLTARKVKFAAVLADTKAYLKSNPETLDWQRVNIGNIGYQIAEKNMAKYLGEQVAKWELDLEPRKAHWDRRIDITTPLQTAGAYFVEAALKDGNKVGCIVWITDTAIVSKHGTSEQQYFVVDATTGTPVAKANLEFFGYYQQPLDEKKRTGKRYANIITRNFAEFTDASGQLFADAKLLKDTQNNYQWLITATTPEGRFAHLGFQNVWLNGQQHQEWNQRKIHVITDRPVYRPAQEVKWKAWARLTKYDSPEDKSEFANQAFIARIYDPKNEKVFEKEYTSDQWGGLADAFKLEDGATLGIYRLEFTGPEPFIQQGTFRVEEYKKPEFEVKVDAPTDPVMLGENVTAKMTATYYFGAPVVNAKVKYKVQRSAHTARWYPYRAWDWFYGPGYWWFGYDYDWYPGFRAWGCRAPVWWWWPQQHDPPELVMESEGAIGPDGRLEIAIDTSLAKELHGDEDHRYEISVEVTDESRRTILGSGQVLVARRPFSVTTWADRGHYEVGNPIEIGVRAMTLDQKGVKGTGRAVLLKLGYNEKGEPQEKDVAGQDITTDEDGMAKVKFSATEAGQYRLSAKVKDAKGREQEGGVLFVIRGGANDGRDYRFAQLELVPEKAEYAPGEEVKLLINTERTDSHVFFYIKPSAGIAPRPQLLKLAGKSSTQMITVALGDMPNFFVEAFTVSDGKVHSAMREIAVPPAKRVLNMEVQANAERYKPRDRAKVKIKLTDTDGKAFVGSTVVTVYDKSLEYISGGSNVPKIADFFWKWRRHHNSASESNLVSFWPSLNIPSNKPGWHALGVFGDSTADMEGAVYFGGGGGKRTGRGGGFGGGLGPGGGSRSYRLNRRMTKNGALSDELAAEEMAAAAPAKPGAPMEANKASADAAPGVGGPDGAQTVMIRSDFADSAFWIQSLDTNSDGLAEIEVPLPDNLTTWKIKAWAMGHGTKVGEAEAEIITSKDLIIRLQAPRFFVEKDEVTLSANVHNYLDTKKDVKVSLELDGACLEPLTGQELTKMISLESKKEQRVDWRVKAAKEGTAVVRMKAITDSDSDAMEMKFPVHVHGMLKTESWSAAIRPDGQEAKIAFTVPNERRPDQSRLEVRYSPSLATAMVDALPYLVDYPYGCTEQTLNRFVPAVIARKVLMDMGVDLAAVKEKRTNLNAQEIGDPQKRAEQWKELRWSDKNPVFDDAEHTLIVKVGLERITSMQNRDGGWGWFSGEREESYPHTTAVVVHGLQVAKAADLAIVPGVLENGVAWLKGYEAGQVKLLKAGDEKRGEKNRKDIKHWKDKADNTDALVRMILADAGEKNDTMTDYLYRDRNDLSVYAKCVFGLALDTENNVEKRDMLLQNIEQFLVKDDENQTARLDLRNGSYWWWWYGSEIEAHAFYLKLLARVKPKSPEASGLVKFLLNNRKNSTWWNSTRDTAYCIEAMADYIKATGENAPDMTVEVLVDGAVKKSVKITKDNLFSFDGTLLMEGQAVTAGQHEITIRRTGSGPVYANVYSTNFTLEDRITKAGLEVKVNRAYFKLVERKDATVLVSGARGQAIDQKTLKYDRLPIKDGDTLKSGELVEVELTLESKNDYEYLLFEDMKPAGFEPDDVRSGYTWEGLGAYREFRDNRVAFFVRALPLGKHNLSYRLRAEIPGKFSALPAKGNGMYAPELRANSDEMKIGVED